MVECCCCVVAVGCRLLLSSARLEILHVADISREILTDRDSLFYFTYYPEESSLQ